jgi:ubiquinone/menaquinone biosynthesis C-methylase UbiE
VGAAEALERHFDARLRRGGAGLDDPALAGALLDRAGDVRGLRALDAGCGRGALAGALGRRGARAAGIDLCASLLGAARASGGTVARADAHRLPFRCGSFDLAFSVLVLHYLEHPVRALRELARVLRPGGRLIACDRTASEDPALRREQERLERLRNPLLGRLLTPGQQEEALRAAGFEPLSSEDLEQERPLEDWPDLGDASLLRASLAQAGPRDLGGLAFAPGGKVRLRLRLICARRATAPPSAAF